MTKREKARADWLFVSFCRDNPSMEATVRRYIYFDEFELLIQTQDGKTYLYNSSNNCSAPKPITIRSVKDLTDEEWRKEFAQRLKSKMINAGVGLEDLSYITGISEYTIDRYMNGETMPSMINVQKIAIALRCTPNDLTKFPTCLS